MTVIAQSRFRVDLPILFVFSVLVASVLPQSVVARAGDKPEPQPGFSYLTDYAPDLVVDLRFFNGRNFVGERIDGYEGEKPMMVTPAAKALAGANAMFEKDGYRIKIFDAYRPQSAVDRFMRWGEEADDPGSKALYYPRLEKVELIPMDYIARKSEHTRGSAVDMTIIALSTGQEVDMGGPYLLFDSVSHLGSKEITPSQQEHRDYLRRIMEANGFEPYSREWWHFHFIKEPFPCAYFNFPVR